MTKRQNKKPTAVKTRWGRILCVWLIVILFSFALVPQKLLPADMAKNDLTIKAYQWRAAAYEAAGISSPASSSTARIAPAAGTQGKGYKEDDRQKLENLISKEVQK